MAPLAKQICPQVLSVMVLTGSGTGVSRSGWLMSMVGPTCGVRAIHFGTPVAAMVRCNLPRVVETLAHACVHVRFSIPRSAAPATMRWHSKSLEEYMYPSSHL